MGSFFLIFLTAIVGIFLYLKIRHQPQLFAGEALQSALFTLGVLALFLILLVSFFIMTT